MGSDIKGVVAPFLLNNPKWTGRDWVFCLRLPARARGGAVVVHDFIHGISAYAAESVSAGPILRKARGVAHMSRARWSVSAVSGTAHRIKKEKNYERGEKNGFGIDNTCCML